MAFCCGFWRFRHSPFSQISGHPPLVATPVIDYLRSGSRLSPHSTSRLARQADTGLAHHRVLDVDELVAVVDANQVAVDPALAVARPVWNWEAANQRKIDAVRQLAPLSDALDEIEARIAELIARTKDLDLG